MRLHKVQLHDSQIVQQFKNSVSQCVITRNFGISSSTVHNIIKRLRESAEISTSNWQGRKPTLNARDLRSLRRHCIKNRHHSVTDITTWAQEHFRKPLSVNTVHRSIYKCKLKLCHAKRKPYINNTQKRRQLLWARAHLRWTDAKWKSVLWSDESTFQIVFGNHGHCVLRAKEGKDCPDCYQHKVQKPASLMVWGCVSAHGMGNLHICEGTINAERYIQVLEQHMLPSKQHNAKPHSAHVEYLDVHILPKWIGRRGPVEWPPRSPDLTSLDFYLWGHLKAIYSVKIRDVQHLKRFWILEACASISSAVLLSVCEEWEKRVALTIQHNGQHFEHIL
uniref:Transposase Tc1-like domain-containing protein n=1 Tax=Pygocentrus nattereri TaxID=42514 RepID=A0AAR2L1I4_PYGNA